MLQCRKPNRLTVSTIILLTLVVNSVTASPCGICGVDIICKSKYPVCSSNQVVTLDICGCCLVCKSILGKGETCSSTVETDFICKVGLECINGIGYETAGDLAKRGAKVILACRVEKKGLAAVRKLIEQTDNPNIFFKPLDLCSFRSVRAFADDIIKTEKRLDILINNAGAGVLPPKTTEDGLQIMMQTNYFGHFLLTNLLLDLIKQTPKSRIVNVSSFLAQYPFKLDVKNLNKYPQTGLRQINDLIMYCRTKLCSVLFTIELTEQLKGTSTTAYSLHPGVINTGIFRNHPLWLRYPTYLTIYLFYKNAIEGAQTTVYCSVTKNIEHLSGDHFQDCKVVDRYPNAWNPDLAKDLWAESMKIVGLHNK